MKLKMYAVRDRASDQFANPMFLTSNGQAIRAFADEINRSGENNMLHQHPEDFDLYTLGEYDTDTGELKPTRPEQLAIGKDLKVKT